MGLESEPYGFGVVVVLGGAFVVAVGHVPDARSVCIALCRLWLRLRLVAVKSGAPDFALRGEDGKYLPQVLLDLDYWALMPV